MDTKVKFNPQLIISNDIQAFNKILNELFTECYALKEQIEINLNNQDKLNEIEFTLYKLIGNISYMILEQYNNDNFDKCINDNNNGEGNWMQEGLLNVFSFGFNAFIDNKERREFIAKCWINIVDKIDLDVGLLIDEWSKYLSKKNFFNYFGLRILTESPDCNDNEYLGKRLMNEAGNNVDGGMGLNKVHVDTVFDKLKLFTETWGFSLKKILAYKSGCKMGLNDRELQKLDEFVNNLIDLLDKEVWAGFAELNHKKILEMLGLNGQDPNNHSTDAIALLRSNYKKNFKEISKILINFLGNILVDYKDFLDTATIPNRLLHLLESTSESSDNLAQLEAFEISGGKQLFLLLIVMDSYSNYIQTSDFEKQFKTQRFKMELTECLFSEDNEERKMGYSLLTNISGVFIPLKAYQQKWEDCLSVFSNLDSFGKYQIEPLWDSKVRGIVDTMNDESCPEEILNEFMWMLKMIVKKGITHANPAVANFCGGWLLNQVKYALPLFGGFIQETLVPLVNCKGLYEDVGLKVDCIPKALEIIRTFIRNLCEMNSQWFKDHISEIIRGGIQLKNLTSVACFWSGFSVLSEGHYQNSDLEIDEDTFEDWIESLRTSIKHHPQFRRVQIITGVLDLLKCCKLDFEKFRLFSQFFNDPSISIYFNLTSSNNQVPRLKLIFENSPVLKDQLLQQIENFGSNLEEIDKQPSKSYESDLFWVTQYFFFYYENNREDCSKVFQNIFDVLENCFERFKKIMTSPYWDFNSIKDLVNTKLIPTLSLLQKVKNCNKILKVLDLDRFDNVALLKNDLSSIFDAILSVIKTHEKFYEINFNELVNCLYGLGHNINLLKEKYDRFCQMNEIFILGEINKESQAQDIKIDKWRFDCYIRFISTHLKKILLSERVYLSNNIIQIYQYIEKAVSLKYYLGYAQMFEVILGYFYHLQNDQQTLPNNVRNMEQLTHYYLDDKKQVNLVNSHNREAIKYVYLKGIKQFIASDEKNLDMLLEQMFSVMEDNKAMPIVQDLMDCFLNLSQIENHTDIEARCYDRIFYKILKNKKTPFQHRKVSLLLSCLIMVRHQNLVFYKKTLKLLVKKREIRPRDCNILLQIEEYIDDYSVEQFLLRQKNQLAVYGAFPRFLILLSIGKSIEIALEANDDADFKQTQFEIFLLEFCEYLLATVHQPKYTKKGQKPYEEQHKQQLCMWQCQMVVSNYLKKNNSERSTNLKTKILDNMLIYLETSLQTTTRHYVEIFLVNCFLLDQQFPVYALKLLNKQNEIKIQPLMSLIFITGYRMVHWPIEDTVFEGLVLKMAGHIGSNTTYIRALSQYFIGKLNELGKMNKSNEQISLLLEIIDTNPRNQILRGSFDNIVKKYSYLIDDMSVLRIWETRFTNQKLECVHSYIIEDLQVVAREQASEVYEEEGRPKEKVELWGDDLKEYFKKDQNPEPNNSDEEKGDKHVEFFQRKIDTLLSSMPEWAEEKRRGELIVVATLVTKLPNLANLTRTCEVFGITSLVIPSMKILGQNDYKNVTVTAEKWIPLIECPRENQVDFIKMKKMTGYEVSLIPFLKTKRYWLQSKQAQALG